MFQALFLLMILCSLTGCQTVGKPDQRDTKAIQAGEKSIVLFRVTTAEEKKGQIIRTGVPFDFTLERLDQARSSEGIFSTINSPNWILPAATVGDQGWRYFVLEPGDYFFELSLCYSDLETSTNPARSFHVPSGKPVVYVGSFGFDQQLIKKSFWDHLVDPTLRHRLTSLGMRDESLEATQIAGEALGEFGPVTTSLAVLYDDQTNAFVGITYRCITGVESGPTALFATDDVGAYATSMVAAPFVAPGAFSLAGTQPSSDDTEKESDQKESSQLAGLVFILAAAPFGIAADKTIGEAARKKWAPFQSALEKEFSRFGLNGRLTDAVTNRLLTLPVSGIATHSPTNLSCSLRIKPYRVLLRETAHHRFALEIGVLVQLFDANSKTVLWQHDYVYGDHQITRENTIPYETWIHATSTSHKLDEYKGEPGVELFRAELSSAINALGEEIIGRLQAVGFSRAK